MKFTEPPDDNCGICGKLIIDHVDAVYSIPDKDGRFRHYDCWEKSYDGFSPKKLKEASDKFQESLNRVRTMVKDLKKKGIIE